MQVSAGQGFLFRYYHSNYHTDYHTDYLRITINYGSDLLSCLS